MYLTIFFEDKLIGAFSFRFACVPQRLLQGTRLNTFHALPDNRNGIAGVRCCILQPPYIIHRFALFHMKSHFVMLNRYQKKENLNLSLLSLHVTTSARKNVGTNNSISTSFSSRICKRQKLAISFDRWSIRCRRLSPL